MMTTMMDDEDDDRLYAELADEMSQPAEDGSDDGWGASSRSDDDGDSGEYRAPEREYEASGTDDDEVERASLQADEWLYEQQARQGQQYQKPDLYEDPVSAVAEIQREMQAARSRQEYQGFMSEVEKHENVFKATVPDYHDAVEHLEKARRSELAKLYPDRSPQAHVIARQHGYENPARLRDAIFMNDAQNVARNALQSGRNPAAVYYELAADRGYQGRGSRSGGRSSGRSSGGRSSRSAGDSPATAKLLDLYVDDPEAFDKQWDRMQKTGALG